MSVNVGLRPVHSGEILRDGLAELGMSANAHANALDVPANRISDILRGHRGVSADTALRLAEFFGTTPQMWLNLQSMYEFREAEIAVADTIRENVVGLESRTDRMETSGLVAGE